MKLRSLAVASIAVLFALGPMLASGTGPRVVDTNAYAASVDRSSSSVMQDNQADDNDNDTAATDNDNDTAAPDNDNDSAATATDNDTTAIDNDNDVSADNDNSGDNNNDNSSGAMNPSTPDLDNAALKQPLAQATGTSTGGDVMIATPGDRVAVQLFPWMPAGVQVTIRPLDPNSVPNVPGLRAGDLVFAVEARDASGQQLTSLPAEANLAVRYADETVSGLNESNITISRLDPSTNLWQAAPKIVRETDSNYIAASITQLGTYVVSAQ